MSVQEDVFQFFEKTLRELSDEHFFDTFRLHVPLVSMYYGKDTDDKLCETAKLLTGKPKDLWRGAVQMGGS